MKKGLLAEIVLVPVICIAHFKLSYNFNESWWHSCLGLCIILLSGYLAWGRRFPAMGGLDISLPVILRSLGLAAGVLAISAVAMLMIASQNNVTIQAGSLQHYIHNAIYIISEEIVLGALLLRLLTEKAGISPLLSSLGLAVLVALAHLFLYKWYFRDKGYLEVTTLLSLVLAVFVKNNLILRFGHIGYAWALHFGWMAVMYGSLHINDAGGNSLTDLQKFNYYLGSPLVMLACLLMASGSLFFFIRRKELSTAGGE